MNENDIDLRSVNWEYGMLLTPEHFERQERYIDSGLLWLLRFATNAHGLVGAGPRVASAERGAAKHDPIVDLHEDETSLKVAVSQCRGLSPSGDIIDIDPSQPVEVSIPKQELGENAELGVYVVCEPHQKVPEEVTDDPNNPQMKSSRRRLYQVKVGIGAGDEPHSLQVCQLRRSDQTLRFEKVGGFIPVCTTMVGHSELTRAGQRLNEQLARLADRYSGLHKGIIEYISMLEPRGIPTAGDEETLRFVGQMVAALESCAYNTMDLTQSPQRFFQELYRAVRSAAVYLDLSPPTQNYFRQLAVEVETEFDSLLDQEHQTLQTSRELTIHDDLSVDVGRIERGLSRLRRLEEALEGKYLDFRLSPALEALTFFFDRQTEHLYQSKVRPAHPQLFREEQTLVFAPLKLEGRQTYRLVLIGQPGIGLEPGANLGAEIKVNVGAGQSNAPIYGKAVCDIPGQLNFAIDFDVPAEVHTIFDLRVILNASWQIKSCMLYERKFLQRGRDLRQRDVAGEPEDPARDKDRLRREKERDDRRRLERREPPRPKRRGFKPIGGD